jgi:hypothetical protein
MWAAGIADLAYALEVVVVARIERKNKIGGVVSYCRLQVILGAYLDAMGGMPRVTECRIDGSYVIIIRGNYEHRNTGRVAHTTPSFVIILVAHAD